MYSKLLRLELAGKRPQPHKVLDRVLRLKQPSQTLESLLEHQAQVYPRRSSPDSPYLAARVSLFQRRLRLMPPRRRTGRLGRAPPQGLVTKDMGGLATFGDAVAASITTLVQFLGPYLHRKALPARSQSTRSWPSA